MKAAISTAEDTLASLIGAARPRRAGRAHRKLAALPARGVRQFFEAVGPAEPEGTPPVFILSAGWRSGSTLLQRLVSSSEGWMIWGEAYDRSAIVQRMADSLAPFDGKWPWPAFTDEPDPETVSEKWIATAYPPISALRDSYRLALSALLADPAKRLGATHWGFKEVRFGLAEALLLQGLFPHARFLFIRRDPVAALESYTRFSKQRNWYDRWPDRPVFTPFAFGRHWGRLSREFETAVTETGGLLIEYDDLVGRRVEVSTIENYLETSIDARLLDTVVGSAKSRKNQRRVTFLDRFMLARGLRSGERLASRAIAAHAKGPVMSART
ncbi:MAG: sulfotransferase [Paracoccaceae bacterium]|nr:sulfotransferase [Paracoccaceae bacterium]